MPTALILDANPTGHGQTMQSYFNQGAPTGWDSVVMNLTPSDGVDEAIAQGYAMIMRASASGGAALGPWPHKGEWDRAWDNGIPVVHAHGSNDPEALTNPPRLFSAIVVGGEDPNVGGGETSYGPGLELDAVAHDGSTAQSWATPTAAAVLARFYEAESRSLLVATRWWNARAKLRMACNGYDAEDAVGGWTDEAGFGWVAHDAPPPAGLDLQPPVDVRAETDGRNVTVRWRPFKTTGYAATRVEVNGEVAYEGTAEEHTFWTNDETIALRLYTVGTDGAVSAAHVPPIDMNAPTTTLPLNEWSLTTMGHSRFEIRQSITPIYVDRFSATSAVDFGDNPEIDTHNKEYLAADVGKRLNGRADLAWPYLFEDSILGESDSGVAHGFRTATDSYTALNTFFSANPNRPDGGVLLVLKNLGLDIEDRPTHCLLRVRVGTQEVCDLLPGMLIMLPFPKDEVSVRAAYGRIGDIDEDGDLDQDDVDALSSIALGAEDLTPYIFEIGDMTYNGELSAIDGGRLDGYESGNLESSDLDIPGPLAKRAIDTEEVKYEYVYRRYRPNVP